MDYSGITSFTTVCEARAKDLYKFRISKTASTGSTPLYIVMFSCACCARGHMRAWGHRTGGCAKNWVSATPLSRHPSELPPLWDATPLMVAMSAGRNAVKPPFFSARRYHAECKCCDTVKERVLGRALACQGSGIACFLIGLKDSATCPMLTCTRLMPLVRPCIMCSHVGMVCHTHTHTHTQAASERIPEQPKKSGCSCVVQ